jgi:hypothetical protein
MGMRWHNTGYIRYPLDDENMLCCIPFETSTRRGSLCDERLVRSAQRFHVGRLSKPSRGKTLRLLAVRNFD